MLSVLVIMLLFNVSSLLLMFFCVGGSGAYLMPKCSVNVWFR